jgi:enterobactin synthetase component D
MPRLAPNPALFPAFVAQCSVSFDANEASDLATQFPGITLPASLSRAVPKRRVEYCAGRFCAREALRICSAPDANTLVGSGPHGEPLWPSGIVGTITHTHEFASAAVALTRDARAIGLDAERTTELSAEVLDYIALPAEIETLALASRMSAESVASVVFSAKETLFKCLYAEVGRYFDFRDALVDSLDAASGRFNVRLLVPLTPRLVAGASFAGRFALEAGRVHTAMVIEP